MNLDQDLLKLARRLVSLEKNKPRQSSLRRAVSTTYYSVFHLLVRDAARQVTPGGSPAFRNQVARAFDHATMRQVCASFSGAAQLPKAIGGSITAPIEAELSALAGLFVDLQAKRHSADYDIAVKFTRLEVLALIRRTRRTVREWRKAPKSENRKVFLTALLVNRLWRAT
jgi:uncharacterized protein (UPF0332 family)